MPRCADRAAAAVTVDIAPFLEIARLLYDGPWVAERTAALRSVLTDRPEILHPVTRAILESGLQRSAVDAFDAFHKLALARRAMAELFERIDALVLPTVPFCPTLEAVAADPIGANARLGTFTNFANLCDLAGYAVPAGFAPDGLPIGVTVLGPAWSEGRLAAIAERLAALPECPPPAVQPDETALFCIGAHMAGLPLNGQITELGGRLLRRSPHRGRLPALRAGRAAGAGARSAPAPRISGEVWALPRAAIGALLAKVAAPLGFGQVELESGPCLGFLAEAAGVAGMPEITGFGGWRAWLKRL